MRNVEIKPEGNDRRACEQEKEAASRHSELRSAIAATKVNPPTGEILSAGKPLTALGTTCFVAHGSINVLNPKGASHPAGNSSSSAACRSSEPLHGTQTSSRDSPQPVGSAIKRNRQIVSLTSLPTDDA
jgi:hypothetical protein